MYMNVLCLYNPTILIDASLYMYLPLCMCVCTSKGNRSIDCCHTSTLVFDDACSVCVDHSSTRMRLRAHIYSDDIQCGVSIYIYMCLSVCGNLCRSVGLYVPINIRYYSMP